MKHLKLIAPVFATAVILTGCGGGGDSTTGSMSPSGTSPPPATTTPETPAAPVTANFTTVVKEQLAATAETSSPIEINNTNFTFEDNDNPAAFDDVLPPREQ